MNKPAMWIMISLAVIVSVGIFGGVQGWWTQDTEDGDTGDDGDATFIYNPGPGTNNNNNYVPPVTGTGNKVPVEALDSAAKNKFTMVTDTDGTVEFYKPDADVSDPYTLSLDNIDLSASPIRTTALVLQTNTNYDIYYKSDGATNYDDSIGAWQINYNPETGKGFLMIGGKGYVATSPVGSFGAVDSLPEVESGMDETGTTTVLKNITMINGTAVSFADTAFPTSDSCGTPTNLYNGTDASDAVDSSNYTISACTATLIDNAWNNSVVTVNYTKTTNDFLRYDESALGGSGWFKVDIGNDNANSELRDVVMCFRDADGDMEGNEVTSLTAAYDSGTTSISLPGSLQQYWEDAMGGGGNSCVKIASVVGGAQKARWSITMTVAEANFDTDEEFEITFDDLGGYLTKQYPSRNAKASAKTLYVGNQA